MLRRSFSVLCLLTALGLIMILMHAAMNKGSADLAIESAREHITQGRAAEAVRILNRAQRSLGTTGERKQRFLLHLLRSRAHAHPSLRNYDKALDDISVLLAEFEAKDFDNADLKDGILEVYRDRIRYLTWHNREDKAFSEAEKLIDSYPKDQLLLDLAGQNLQRLYQKKLRELNDKKLPESLTPKHRRDLLKLVLPYVYRMQGGTKDRLGREEIAAFLAGKEIDPKTIEARLGDLDHIRKLIRHAAQYYRRALLEKGGAAASLRGYSGILMRAGRANEAIVLAWLYMQRFGAYLAAISAGQAMAACLSLDNPRLAIFIGRRWFESVEQAKTGYRGDSRWVFAYVQFARATFELRDVDALRGLREKIERLDKNGNFAFWYGLIAGLEAALEENSSYAESQLGAFCRDPRNLNPPIEGKDLLALAMQVRLTLALDEQAYHLAESILREWTGIRPKATEPLLRLTKLRIEKTKRPHLAARDAVALHKLEDSNGSKDKALELLRLAKDLAHASEGKDSKTLFETLLKENRILAPDLPAKVQHLSIAKLARKAGRPRILLANLRRYLHRYPFSSEGRYLLATQHLLLDEAQKALFETEAILDRRPDHLRARLLRRKILVKRKADITLVREESLELLERHPARVESTRLFGEMLLTNNEFENALLVSEQSRAADESKHVLSWIRGKALIGLERFAEAVESLLAVPPEQEEYPRALGLAIQTAVEHSTTIDLDELVRKLLRSKASSELLLETAQRLAENERYAAAKTVLAPILAEPDRFENRSGDFHLLRARILLALGKDAEAKSVLEGAFSYGNNEAGPLLVLSAVLEGDQDLAKSWLDMLPKLQGQPLVMAYLQFRLKNEKGALAEIDRARLSSKALDAILRSTLRQSLARDESSDLDRPTGNQRLDRFLALHAPLVFEALCLAPAFEFRGRASKAMDSLLAMPAPRSGMVNFGSEVESFMQKSRTQFLQAFWLELAGKKLQATGLFLATLEDWTMLLTSFPEVFRMLPKNAELLTQPDFIIRYLFLVGNSISHPFLRDAESMFAKAAASLALGNNDMESFRIWIRLAQNLTPEDKGLTMLVARSVWETGEHAKALRSMNSLLNDVTGTDLADYMERVMDYALEAFDLPGASMPGTPLEKAIARLAQHARQYHDKPKTPERRPVGKASLFHMRYLATDADLVQAPVILARRQESILAFYLQSFLQDGIAPSLDEEGLVAVLSWLLMQGKHDAIDKPLLALLQLDPALSKLWLFRARLLESRGRPKLAERLLTWLCDYLKSKEILTELARLRGSHGLGSVAENRVLLRAIEARRGKDRAMDEARSYVLFRLGRVEDSLALMRRKGLGLPGEGSGDLALLRDLCVLFVGEQVDYGALGKRMEERARDPALVKTFRAFSDVAAQLGFLAQGK